MRGNITRRGKISWRIKFEIEPDDATGKRKYHVETVRGTKADAVNLLAKRLSERGEGQLVERSALTIADYSRHWLAAIAPAKTSGKTRERYLEIVEKHIVPHLGTVQLQKLDGPRIDAFYAKLGSIGRRDRKGGLAPQTVLHIHRILSMILASAVKAQKLRSSPMTAVQATGNCDAQKRRCSTTTISLLSSDISKDGNSTCRSSSQRPPECVAVKSWGKVV